MRRFANGVAVLLLAFLANAAPAGTAPLRLLAMGDWGRNNDDQKITAHAMAEYAQSHPISAVLLAGDNFYIKVKDVNDPILQTVFDKIYGASSLNVPFYASLGNHDYQEGKKEIELAYSKRGGTKFTMPAANYRVDLPKENPVVTLLMLDSNKPLMKPGEWAAQLKWMQQQLAEVQGKRWIVCCAHHPFFSNGDHGDNGELHKGWGPLFEKYGVDLYVCGHDHDLQHLEMPHEKVSLVLVGGGGSSTRPMRQDKRGPFSHSAHGFGSIEFTPALLTVHILDSTGEELHSFNRTRSGKVLPQLFRRKPENRGKRGES